MHLNTHRFERYYLNSLLGDFDNNKNIYYERSPINNISKINTPLLLFHGKKDSVIDYRTTINFRKKLLINKIYSELYIFEDEGHGFKKIKNKIDVLDKTEEFLSKIIHQE